MATLPPEVAAMLRDDGSVAVPAAAAEPLLRVLVRALVAARRDAAGGQLGTDAVAVLYALHYASVRHREGIDAATGTEVGDVVTLGSEERAWVTVREAAGLLECTERAVRKACAEGRLQARRAGSRVWLVDRAGLERYRSAA